MLPALSVVYPAFIRPTLGQFVCRVSILVGFLLASAASPAETQSLGLELNKSEDFLGNNESLETQPRRLALHYALSTEALSLGASVWDGGDDIRAPSGQFDLQQKLSGALISLTTNIRDYSISIGLTQQVQDLEARIVDPASPYLGSRYQEETRVTEFFLNGHYTFSAGNFDYVLGLGAGWQDTDLDATRNAQLPSGFLVLDNRDQKERGRYVDASLGLHYWIEQVGSTVWKPGLDIGWIEPVSGQVSIQDSRHVRGSRTPYSASSLSNQTTTPGSGYYELSLASFLSSGIYASLSMSRTFKLENNSRSFAVELGFDF